MQTLAPSPLRAGDFVSDEKARYILNGVVTRTLPRPEWTHHAHLVFATALLDAEGLAGAEEAAPNLIRGYNESVGGVNDDTQGYHHTITLLFLRHIDAFLAPYAEERIGARATRLLASPLAATDYPLRFYSKERLFSVEARRGWLEPDLEPPATVISVTPGRREASSPESISRRTNRRWIPGSRLRRAPE